MLPLHSRIVPTAIALVLVTTAACGQAQTPTQFNAVPGEANTNRPAFGVLAAPVMTRPECGAVTAWPEGLFTFAWERVDAASSYTVEVDCFPCGDQGDPWFSQSGTPWHIRRGLGLPTPTYVTDIVSTLRREGGRQMRWRVWAVDSRGVEGTKSEWCMAAFSEDGLPTPSSGIPKPGLR